MKKVNNCYLILLLFIIYPCNLLIAQQANNWYFGEGTGITFNTVPPTELPNTSLNSMEGCASISDSKGQLLFFTDGVNVYGPDNRLLSNGFGLMGHSSSTQSAMIVQQPGSENIFYIFTAPYVITGPEVGYRYCKVEMNLDNKHGSITEYNVLLHTPGSEKLTAIRHANGRDVWIMLLDAENEKMLAYKLGCDGLDMVPVVSDIPLRPNTAVWHFSLKQGYMRGSPDGKLLAMAATGSVNDHLHIRICQVNNVTGAVSPPILIPVDNGMYGVEFSPDSKILYVSDHPDTGGIFQLNVSVFDSAGILHSMYYINTLKSKGALQMGPDKKIYISNYLNHYLSCISNPNVMGPGCGFIEEGLLLRGTVKEGLPNFTANQPLNEQASINTSINDPCSSAIQFSASSTLPGNLSWHWDFGDGSTSSSQNPSHLYHPTASKKTFTVQLDVVSDFADCNKAVKAVSLQPVTPYFSQLNAGNDTITLIKVPLQLRATGAKTYVWSPATGLNDAGIPNPVTTLTKDQVYIVKGTSTQGCVAYDTINVKVVPEATILVAGAFTPDNNGLNDDLHVFYTAIKQLLYFRIYNRYGQLVFSTNEMNGYWDGKFKGSTQPVGTYLWFAGALTGRQENIYRSGTVILLR